MAESVGIKVTRADPHAAGRCNFCSRKPGRAVYVLGSDDEHCHVEARVCPLCAAELMHELILELA